MNNIVNIVKFFHDEIIKTILLHIINGVRRDTTS